MKEEEKPAGPSSEVVEELEKKLGFYCKDLKKLDEKISPRKTVRLCTTSWLIL